MIQGREPTVIEVCIAFTRHPCRYLIRCWNWKTGLISLGWRGSIFLTANLSAGVGAGLNALLVEACYRPVLSGFLSALTQAFRFATPGWLSTLVAVGFIPVLSHVVEFAVHSLCRTPRLGSGVAASLLFTVTSSILELFAMRRGILVVEGASSRSLLQDLRGMTRQLKECRSKVPQLLRGLAHLLATPGMQWMFRARTLETLQSMDVEP